MLEKRRRKDLCCWRKSKHIFLVVLEASYLKATQTTLSPSLKPMLLYVKSGKVS